LKDFFEKLDTKKQVLIQQIKELNYELLIENYNKSKLQITQSLDKIKEFFAKVDWKIIKSNFELYKDFDLKLKKVDQEI